MSGCFFLKRGVDGSGGSGGGVAYEARGTSKAGAWQTNGRADGQAHGPNRAKIALNRAYRDFGS